MDGANRIIVLRAGDGQQATCPSSNFAPTIAYGATSDDAALGTWGVVMRLWQGSQIGWSDR